MEKYAEFGAKYNNMLTVSDFNIHVEDVTNGHAEQFIYMCKAIDQHGNFATHHDGHTLDFSTNRTELCYTSELHQTR